MVLKIDFELEEIGRTWSRLFWFVILLIIFSHSDTLNLE
jgi:hypothetical protein